MTWEDKDVMMKIMALFYYQNRLRSSMRYRNWGIAMSKIEQLREYMEKEGLDGFYVANPANVRAVSA